MADQKSSKADDGRGQPGNAELKTVEPQAHDGRLIPGGSFRAARTPIGMNAVDRADAERPPHPPEPPTATGR